MDVKLGTGPLKELLYTTHDTYMYGICLESGSDSFEKDYSRHSYICILTDGLEYGSSGSFVTIPVETNII